MVFEEGEEIPRIVQAIGTGGVILAIFLVMFAAFSATTLATLPIINNSPIGHINFNSSGFETDFTLAHNSSEFAFRNILNESVILSNTTLIIVNADKNGNWTVNPTTGQIRLHSGGVLNNSIWNVSYSYVKGDKATLSIDRIIGGFDGISGFWDILAVGAMAGLILVVLMVLFQFGPFGGSDSGEKRF